MAMISNVSGPIPTHELYLNPTNTLRSNTKQNQQKLYTAFDNLDILQWQSNMSSIHSYRPVTASGHRPKDYIRDNIRRIRDFQRYGVMKNLYNPMKSIKSQFPPRPGTADLKYQQYAQKKDFKNPRNSVHEAGLGDQGTLNCDDPSTDWSLDPQSSDCGPPDESPVVDLSTGPPAAVCCRSTQYASPEDFATVSKAVQVRSTELLPPKSSVPPKEPAVPRVQPTLVQQRVRPASAGPTKHEFLRAHAKTAADELKLQMLGSIPIRKPIWTPRPEQLTVPSASSAKTVQLIRRNINYIRANAHLAAAAAKAAGNRENTVARNEVTAGQKSITPQPRLPTFHGGELTLCPERRLPVGSLPPYLIKRRRDEAIAAAREAASRPDPDQPPGYQRMPEEERVNTLHLLRKAHSELIDEWSKLPVRMDTMRIRARREELEQRLNELEEAISIFDKPKVFIKPE